MRFLADECISTTLVGLLRQEGLEIETVAEIASGSDDETVLTLSLERGRVLLTRDYDFARLVFQLKRKALGVVMISPGLFDKPIGEVASIIGGRLASGEYSLAGMLSVLETERTRQRALPE